MTIKREAFITTVFSNYPIVIESMTDESFTFVSDSEFPLEIPLFLEDPEQVVDGMVRMKKFEIIESHQIENQFRYQAIFRRNTFNFEEWEKKHKRA